MTMAIYKKDRSFDKIFEEVTLEKIPMDYVMQVRLCLHDGTIIDMDPDQFSHLDDPSQILGQVKFASDIKDVSISLDYESIKNDISNSVRHVFNNYFGEDE
jgi:hypothetical protein